MLGTKLLYGECSTKNVAYNGECGARFISYRILRMREIAEVGTNWISRGDSDGKNFQIHPSEDAGGRANYMRCFC
jgi:hypothetical protein